MDQVTRRTQVLRNHLLCRTTPDPSLGPFAPNHCLNYSPPDLVEPSSFNPTDMRLLLDGHNVADRDWLFGLMTQSRLFNPQQRGAKVFVSPDYNQSMEQQREATMKRVFYLLEKGVYQGWLTETGPEAQFRRFALNEVIGIYDHSLAIKLGVHFFLCLIEFDFGRFKRVGTEYSFLFLPLHLLVAENRGGAIQFFGTKSHHEKWLRDTENYEVKGCFAMTELGHGSNVRGIETVTTYDSNTGEFIINTPCESAQKYWIGGAAKHATHTIVFSQLSINGKNQGVHAFITQIRDADGNVCPNIRIADCGHKIGLNGVDNGRIWFNNVRVPRENLLNSVADVSQDGQYLSAIEDPVQRFAAFLAPLTVGRVNIAVAAIYSSKTSLAIAIRYSLTRRAFSVTPNGPEVLLLDYPSHQRRLLPLLAKTYAMSFAGNDLKKIYVKRTPESNKMIHVFSSAFKATFTWHNMRTLQECREACGGQGLKTENRVGHLKGEYDVQSTFEGDNNILMQQVSKALHGEYIAAKKRSRPFKGLGLEHMNSPCPIIPSQLTSSDLRSSQFQTDAFCLRERDLLNRFATEVLKHQAQGQSKEHAFNLSYELAEDLGRAFSQRTILQMFIEAEATVPSGSLKDILSLLRSMYALIFFEEDAAFLRYGYLSTDNADAVRKEVTKLCSELRPHALALVNSFGIPDSFLGPIAFNWIDANAWSSVQQ
ncbi:Acyl-coenzyme A oxidase 3, peroxisomal [Morella rubra]|uniref:Acyl-coenzyme A oxidase n=1 Tax=Morella rubra TaxID=262757 RepID=A0A6A1VU88_9ROSI|nr:Acyl-coenzyme A oxidase 3, peroxisomal [Morella rubra]